MEKKIHEIGWKKKIKKIKNMNTILKKNKK